jgi:hypothetical protein
MSNFKYAKCFALIALAGLFVGGNALAFVSTGASCNLTRIQVATGSQTATTEMVLVTATPSCWSGLVDINRGNIDFHLISVSVNSGHGTGSLLKISTTQEVHPYATNPGLRGNNIIIACGCIGTGLTGLSITQSKLTTKSETISIVASPSTWAGTVNIVDSTGTVLLSATIPSSTGYATIALNADGSELVHVVYSKINSNAMNIP